MPPQDMSNPYVNTSTEMSLLVSLWGVNMHFDSLSRTALLKPGRNERNG